MCIRDSRCDGHARTTLGEFGPSIVLAFFRPKMGGFQPFLRARRANYMTEGLGDVAGAHWQHTKRRLAWGPLPKRSETAQLFLAIFSEIARVSRPAGDLVGPGRWAPTTRAEDPRTLAYRVDAPEGR